MSDYVRVPILQRELEHWSAEVTRLNHEVDAAEADLRRVGWNLKSNAQTVRFYSLRLGKLRKQRGYAKHRMARLLSLLEAQNQYVP